MNVLEQCGVLNSQIGQLVVAIAIVDDILALVVLSQLRALTGDVTILSIVIPIISAFLWLFVGGALAVFVVPFLLERLEKLESALLSTKFRKQRREDSSNGSPDNPPTGRDVPLPYSHLWHVLILLMALLPATFYTEASYLLGAFLAGLAACRCHPQVAAEYQEQFALPIAWLMRIFFGATIGFEIPVTLFLEDPGTVLGPGFLLALSLLGKVATGPLLTPVLEEKAIDTSGTGTATIAQRRWDRQHLRDVAVVGFSMAGEAEFAFLVAGFGLTEGLFDETTYASIVFAILLSTIISPVLLRTTLSVFETPGDNALEDSVMDIKNTKHEDFSEENGNNSVVRIDEQNNASPPQIEVATENTVRFQTILTSSDVDKV
jgi:Kef-type K+ transport system membrane component KefB